MGVAFTTIAFRGSLTKPYFLFIIVRYNHDRLLPLAQDQVVPISGTSIEVELKDLIVGL